MIPPEMTSMKACKLCMVCMNSFSQQAMKGKRQKGEIKSALVLFYLNIILRLGNQPDLNYSVKSFNFSIRRCIWITLLAFA